VKVYLAGTHSRAYVIEEPMKVYLAGTAPWRESGIYDNSISSLRPYVLESFFSLKGSNEPWVMRMRPLFKSFLLDSGAFTFMSNVKGRMPNFDNYVEEYAAFIKAYNVDLFFELDIDSVVGLPEVERLRIKLESLTGKQCIPVWHKSRGLEYWERMCKEYKYIAIGGIVTKEIKPENYNVFTFLLRIAKENGCKVHGLGFTNMKGMKKYKFDSVDSTAWIYGNRGGFLYKFNGVGIDKIVSPGRLKGRAAAAHNFQEWVKFSNYAEKNL
jgi:hypothetical protein